MSESVPKWRQFMASLGTGGETAATATATATSTVVAPIGSGAASSSSVAPAAAPPFSSPFLPATIASTASTLSSQQPAAGAGAPLTQPANPSASTTMTMGPAFGTTPLSTASSFAAAGMNSAPAAASTFSALELPSATASTTTTPAAAAATVTVPASVLDALASQPYAKPLNAATGALMTAARLEAVRQRAEEQALEEAIPMLVELSRLHQRLEARQGLTGNLEATVRDQEAIASLLPAMASDIRTLRSREENLKARLQSHQLEAQRYEEEQQASSEARFAAEADLARMEREFSTASKRRDALRSTVEARLKVVNDEMRVLERSAGAELAISTARLRTAQAQTLSYKDQVRVLERENREVSALCEQLLHSLEGLLELPTASSVGSGSKASIIEAPAHKVTHDAVVAPVTTKNDVDDNTIGETVRSGETTPDEF